MKIIILFLSLFLTSMNAIMGQTATDFTATDCSGASHNLFSELDSGNVIVMVWVMPCGGCIVPAQTAYNASLPFQSAYSHRVFYYLVDDLNNTSCPVLSSWATTNSISPNAIFTSSAINMADYDSAGMPKIVVLGGNSHTVFYNENYVCDSTQITAAISNALTAANTIGISENFNTFADLALFPNPAKNETSLSFNLASDDFVTIEIETVLGKKIQLLENEHKEKGKQNVKINTQTLSKGIYFITVAIGNTTGCIKFVVN